MIKLVMLEAASFMSFEKIKLSLEEAGLCLIGGRNLDENDSNGSGKTTLISAVTWCLYGRTIDGLKADDVLSWHDPKDCYSRVWLTKDEEDIQITRYRNWKGEGSRVEVNIKGENHVGKPTEMQGFIDHLLGVDYETLVTTAVYTQDSAKLIAGATDSTRRQVFSKLLNLGRYDRAHRVAKEKVKKARGACEGCQIAIDVKTSELKSFASSIERLSPLEAGFDNERIEKIKSLEETYESIGERLLIKPLRSRLARAEDKLEGYDIAAVEGEAAQARFVAMACEEELNERNSDLANSKTVGSCPTCGRSFDEGDREVVQRGIRSDIEEVQKKKDEANHELQLRGDLLGELRPHISKAEKLRGEIALGERTNERRKWRREVTQEKIDELRNAGNPFTAELALAIEGATTSESMLKLYEDDEKEATVELQTSEMMEHFYSKKGVQAFIIENSFGFIQDKANYYLTVLTGGTTQIEVSPTKETKGGEAKEEITITVLRGGNEAKYGNLSGGEQQRVSIALLFAINSYMRTQCGVDFLLLDEVLDLSLDETGQEALVALLGELARDVSSIFVISHKQFIKEHFNKIIDVEKKNGVSRVVGGEG